LESARSDAFDEHDLRVLTNIAATAALVIERARLFEETQRRLHELELLQELSAELRQARTIEEMIPVFVQHAVQAVNAQVGTIFLLEETSGDWVSRGWVNAQGEWVIPSGVMRHRHAEGITGKVGISGEIYITHDWRTDSFNHPLPEEETLLATLRCAITLPLRTESRTIGVMHIWFAQAHIFSDAEKRLLTAIADMAGNALQRVRLFAETQRRAEKMTAVNALGRALAATLDLPLLCRTAHQHIRTLVACDNLSITLYDAEARTLRPAFVISEEQELDVTLLPPLTIDPNAPRAGRAQAILDAQTVVLNDLGEKARQAGGILVGSETEPQSAAYTPMLVEGKVIGLLELQSYHNHAYSSDDLDLLQMLANQIGLAIQNARLFGETRARLNELNTLHQASQTLLTSALDPEATYVAIHQAIARVMPCEALSIVLEDESLGDYHGVYLYDKSGRTPSRRISRGAGLSGRVIPSGKTLQIDDYAAQNTIAGVHFGDPERVRSILAVPLRRGDQTIGMVATQSYQPHAFTSDHRVLLETLAAQFATSIENARLYEQTSARLRELQVIATVSSALSAASTRAEMYTAVLDQLVPALDVDGALIETFDPLSGELVIQAARGVGESLVGRRIPRGESLSAHVLATGKPYLNNEARNDSLLFSAEAFGECRAAAGVPMRIGTQILGLAWIASRRALTDDDGRVLTAIANIAANALHRASLNEQTERQLNRLAVLRTIDRVISSSFDVLLTLGIILEHTLTELGVDAVSVLVHRPYTHILEHLASRGFRTRAIEQTRLRMGESFAGRAALEQQIVHISDLRTRANDFIVKDLVAEGYTEYYGVPLIAKGHVVGVLEIFHRAPLPRDPEWREFCETLAGQAAIAIDNARLFNDLQQSNTDLVLAYDATIEGWSRALDLRDKETEGHTQRVTQMTLDLARRMGISEEALVHIRRGALLHDIGKIAVPDSILLKPGALTEAEWVIMREHPRHAYEMLLPIEYLRPALDIPYCHHEKWDGTGYPRGLKGEEIPLAARIFAVADVYDALTSDRPYRAAWSVEQAREYIRAESGKHFDPRVVDRFL
jgi:HD-GYP domain-containing protein (c-di-GMP phosphodiesterase class II)